jgi:Sec-independent protein translocase protein TatA
MFGRSKSKAPSLGDSVSEAAYQVRDWAEHVWQDSAHRAAPVVDAASKKLSEAAHKVGDAASNFQHKVQDDYIPSAAGQLAPVAAGGAKAIKATELPNFVNDTITRVTGDKKAGRKLQKAAEQWAKQAEKQLKKQAKRNKKSRRGVLVVGITVATAGAAYAVWRLSQPVEDPWTNPTPQPLSN